MKPRYEHPGMPDGTTVTCSVRRQKAFDFSWHFHREYEITLITEGTGTRYVGTTVEPYGPGDLVLVGPDLPHTFTSEPYDAGMAEAIVAQFGEDFLGPGFFSVPQFHQCAELLARAASGLRFAPAPAPVCTLLAGLPALETMAARTVGLLDALQQLACTGGGESLTLPGCAPAPGTAVRERVDRVCRHLQRAHTRPVELAEVAAVAHMAPTSFSRFFRRAMGRTLTEYVNQLRVETACRLLTTTELPVTEVAVRSGYQNLSNFNRRFRRLKRMCPRDYRAAHRPAR